MALNKHQPLLMIAVSVVCLCGVLTAGAAEVYHTNRTFTAVTINAQGNPPLVDQLYTEACKLTVLVKGEAITIRSNETYAIERQGVALGYASSAEAWAAAVAYNATNQADEDYTGKIYDNAGWVRGTTSADGKWGAYLWTLQNRIAFQSSATNWWTSPSNGVPVAISNVLVGSLGDYPPMAETNDTGPIVDTNFPGENQGESQEYYADLTNVYYQLIVPAIWITPRAAYAAAGGEDVQYTVAGTDIVNGVTWAIIPEGVTSGAVIQASNDWHYAGVTPGTVATNYKVRATSVDNTNFYDEVDLTVVGLHLMQYKIGTNTWSDMPDPLYVWTNTTVYFQAIKIPTKAPWPSGKPVWGGVASGSGMETNSYTFNTISTSATDYKIVTVECGNTVTGRVIVANFEIREINFTSDHASMINHFYGAYSVSTGEVYNPRGWRNDPAANNPISHEKEQNVSVNMIASVQPAGEYFDVEGYSTNDYLTFDVSNVMATGTNQAIPITSNGKLPMMVANMTEAVVWKLKMNGTVFASETIAHHIYMTWGNTLGLGPTRVRVARVCNTASGLTNEEQIADAIWNDVADPYHTTFNPYGENEGWELFDSGTSGDCDNQALCMAVAVEMVGIGAADVELVYASTNSGAGNCLNMDTRSVTNQNQYLIFDFLTSGTNHEWNAFEGCCKAADRFYAITPKYKTTNDYQMLQVLPCRQYWVAMSNDVMPGSCTNWADLVTEIEEVPKP